MVRDSERTEPGLEILPTELPEVESFVRSQKATAEKYRKHRWKFVVFGAISGVLLSIYSPSPGPSGGWIQEMVGGALLWYALWWLWAWSKKRQDLKRSE